MEVDYYKVKSRIVEKYHTIREFAKAWNKSVTWVSYKLNGKRKLTSKDITEISALLEIDVGDVPLYFHAKRVP